MPDKISIVVPCFNEEQSVELFYTELKKAISEMQVDFELLFIDDGSQDGTLQAIQQIADEDAQVFYLSFSRNFGKEAAIYAGLEHATGDYVVLMDVDLQDPPSLIPDMYKIIKEETYDCVATRRTTRKNEPRIRSAFAHVFYKLFNKMTNLQVVDGARDFRMMSGAMTDSILRLREHNRFSKGLFSWVGYRIKWLDYENIERKAGVTKWSFKKLSGYAAEGFIAFSDKPLYLSGITGALLLLATLLAGIVMGICLILGNPIDPAWWIGLSMCLLFGIAFVFMGILGAYISKIAQESKDRPLFIVKSTNVTEEKQMKRKNLR